MELSEIISQSSHKTWPCHWCELNLATHQFHYPLSNHPPRGWDPEKAKQKVPDFGNPFSAHVQDLEFDRPIREMKETWKCLDIMIKGLMPWTYWLHEKKDWSKLIEIEKLLAILGNITWYDISFLLIWQSVIRLEAILFLLRPMVILSFELVLGTWH